MVLEVRFDKEVCHGSLRYGGSGPIIGGSLHCGDEAFEGHNIQGSREGSDISRGDFCVGGRENRTCGSDVYEVRRPGAHRIVDVPSVWSRRGIFGGYAAGSAYGNALETFVFEQWDENAVGTSGAC